MDIEKIKSQIIRYNPKLFPMEAKNRRKRKLLSFLVALCIITICLVIMFVLVMAVSPKENRTIKSIVGYAQSDFTALGGDFEDVLVELDTDTQKAEISLSKPVMAGVITSTFGERVDPFGTQTEFHKGLDIADNLGTPIYSAESGKVIVSDYNKYAGNYIIIEHSGNVKTRYLHCSELLVKEGDSVEKGDKIALMGSTGNSTGPHLHFEVHINDVAVNPSEYFDD